MFNLVVGVEMGPILFVEPVPEPTALALVGICGVVLLTRRFIIENHLTMIVANDPLMLKPTWRRKP
jgi:xanthosine utilization system XapX-like protein